MTGIEISYLSIDTDVIMNALHDPLFSSQIATRMIHKQLRGPNLEQTKTSIWCTDSSTKGHLKKIWLDKADEKNFTQLSHIMSGFPVAHY